MGEEKEYGLLIAAVVSIVAIVGLVILFSRGAPVGKLVAVSGEPATAYFTGEGSTGGWADKGQRGEPRYMDRLPMAEAGLNDCPTGMARWTPSGGYVCEPANAAQSPYGQINTASGYSW